jgi:hypothetical protein
MEVSLTRDWKPRRSVRLAVRIGVRLHLPGGLLDAEGTDLNEHGMFLQTQEALPVDQTIVLDIDLPDGILTIEARPRFVGHTIWGPGVGIEFTQEEQARYGRWLRYIRSFSSSATPGGA